MADLIRKGQTNAQHEPIIKDTHIAEERYWLWGLEVKMVGLGEAGEESWIGRKSVRIELYLYPIVYSRNEEKLIDFERVVRFNYLAGEVIEALGLVYK